jgi:hypothetical protein
MSPARLKPICSDNAFGDVLFGWPLMLQVLPANERPLIA